MSLLALALGCLAGAGTLVVVAVLDGRPAGSAWRRPALWVTGAGLTALALVVFAAPRWDARWYRDVSTPNLAGLNREVQDGGIDGARIAVGGIFHTYPLYGKDFGNEVVYVGNGDAAEPWQDGEANAWLAALRARCVDYVAVEDDEEHWLHAIPELGFVEQLDGRGVERVMSVGTAGSTTDPRVGLYRVDGACG